LERHSRGRRWVAPALCCWTLGVGAAGPTSSPSPGTPARPPTVKPFEIERVDWTGSAELSAAVQRIVVRNDYGDIRARFAGDGLIALHAVVQRLGADPDVGVNVERHGDTLVLAAVAPPGRIRVDQERLPKSAVDRVDLVVYVPGRATLEAESMRGLIEARGLKGDVRAETLDGEIRVNTSGGVQARSQSGALTVGIGKESGRPSQLESGSGAIWLALPADGDFHVQVETSGEVRSEIALQSAEPHAGRRRASARLGRAWLPVTVRSEKGDIEVARLR
jgi:hypothetical protein